MVYTWKALLSPSKRMYPVEMIHTAWGITSTRPYLRAANSWPQWTPAERMSEAVESISTSCCPWHIDFADREGRRRWQKGMLLQTSEKPALEMSSPAHLHLTLFQQHTSLLLLRQPSQVQWLYRWSKSASTTNASKASWVSVHHLLNLMYNNLNQI